jgi:hypothetical protein
MNNLLKSKEYVKEKFGYLYEVLDHAKQDLEWCEIQIQESRNRMYAARYAYVKFLEEVRQQCSLS